jgi:hypothetical protein
MQPSTSKSSLKSAQAFTGRRNGRMVSIVHHENPGVYLVSLISEESGDTILAPQVLCLSLSQASKVAETWLDKGTRLDPVQ